MSELLCKESVGVIQLGENVRISDPCYGIDTWCAGTLENVLAGEYQCFSQKCNEDFWKELGLNSLRISNIEVRHKDYLDVEPTELQDIDVGVDSGQCGIYDLNYFSEHCKKEDWYERVCDKTYISKPNPDHIPFNDSSFYKALNGKFEGVYEALEAYRQTEGSRSTIEEFAANTMDDKCLVSSSGDGDGSYYCLVGRNEEGQIVSIKVDYYGRELELEL